MHDPNDPYTAKDALYTLDSIIDTPPRDSPGLNGGHPSGSHYAWNDEGNAQRLLDAGGKGTLLYVPKRQFPWHIWDGNCWAVDRRQQVGRRMQETLHAAYAAVWQNGQPRATQTDEARALLGAGNAPRINGALTELSRKVSVEPGVFDTHDWYLPCNNRLTYDMETGEVITSRPEHRMTRCVPVAAITEPAEHPNWDEMLRLATGSNADQIRYVRWTCGLFTTGYVGEKAFWFWQGQTNTGKTTLLTFLARLLGEFAYTIPLKALLQHRHDPNILHDIAGIRGMRLVYAEEFKPGDVLDSSWVKRISGGGDITADRKGEPDETFRSTAKLVIGTNDMPAITDVDSALRGRTRVVPFPTDIPAALREAGKPVPSVDEVVAKLMSEAPAILYDLMLAVGEWRAAGRQLGMPQTVAEASKQYIDTQDPLLDWFEACFEHEADGSLTKSRAEWPLAIWYWSFLTQADRANTPSLYQRFGQMLVSKGFEKRVAYDGKRYTGPALTEEAHAKAVSAMEADKDSWRYGREYGGRGYAV
jgi:P4 family phage/plasmid primase-like protien